MLNGILLHTFKNRGTKEEIEELINQGANKQIIIDYAKTINPRNMSMQQGWILSWLNGGKY